MVIVDGNRVEFRFLRPEARAVFVAGEFNHWMRDQFRMSKGSDGVWRLVVFLPPGTYRFRYCADGEWFADFAAFGVRPGPYGPDGVIIVGEPRRDRSFADLLELPVAPRRSLKLPQRRPRNCYDPTGSRT